MCHLCTTYWLLSCPDHSQVRMIFLRALIRANLSMFFLAAPLRPVCLNIFWINTCELRLSFAYASCIDQGGIIMPKDINKQKFSIESKFQNSTVIMLARRVSPRVGERLKVQTQWRKLQRITVYRQELIYLVIKLWVCDCQKIDNFKQKTINSFTSKTMTSYVIFQSVYFIFIMLGLHSARLQALQG